MKRVIVLGAPGSGKTTLAKKIAEIKGLQHIEIDSIFWGENWAEPDLDEFRTRFSKLLNEHNKGWVICGNYKNATGELHWEEADTIILLDIPLVLSMLRIIRRSLKRIITKEKLWGKNTETWRGALLSKHSLLSMVPKSRKKAQRRFLEAEKLSKHMNKTFMRFRTNRAAEEWIQQR